MVGQDPRAVSVVGAGNMGAAMVATLRRAGRPVALYNRTRTRAAEIAATVGWCR